METVAKINAAAACPTCSTKTLKVEPITVRSLVKPEIVERVRDETYRFCPSNTCDIVYFSSRDPEQRFFRADMKVRVGQKETSGPIQVCYCFDWTTDDIAQDLRDTGETTVPDRIKRLIQLGFCRCETMNPHGNCCLGEVNRAVKEARTKYAQSASDADHRDDRTIREANSAISEITPSSNKPTRAAGIAALSAVFTAIIGSACCWLPLLLIALGFSAAGVSRAFERFQPLLIIIAFALLGSAWVLSYRSTLYRLWARATGKPACGTHIESCRSIDSKGKSSALFNSFQGDSTMSDEKHSCCDIDPNSSLADAECSKAETSTDRPTRRGISTPRMSRLMLWIATGLIPLFVFFPYWSGLIFGSGVGFNPFLISMNEAPGGGGCCAVSQTKAISPVSTTVSADSIVLKLEGLTCEGCAATVRQALSRAPGVDRVNVSFSQSMARVYPKTGSILRSDEIVKVVEKAGYHAKVESRSDQETEQAKNSSSVQSECKDDEHCSVESLQTVTGKAISNPGSDRTSANRQLIYRVKGLECQAVQGLGCGHRLSPVLTRLDGIKGIESSMANRPGTMIRIIAAPDTKCEEVDKRIFRVLSEDGLEPVRIGDEDLERIIEKEEWREARRIGELSSIEFQTLSRSVNQFAEDEKLGKKDTERLKEIWNRRIDSFGQNLDRGGSSSTQADDIQGFIKAISDDCKDLLSAKQVERLISAIAINRRPGNKPLRNK